MKTAKPLALHGGPKAKTTPYGAGLKHDARVETDRRVRSATVGWISRAWSAAREGAGHHRLLCCLLPAVAAVSYS